jgi:hypothetical protein
MTGGHFRTKWPDLGDFPFQPIENTWRTLYDIKCRTLCPPIVRAFTNNGYIPLQTKLVNAPDSLSAILLSLSADTHLPSIEGSVRQREKKQKIVRLCCDLGRLSAELFDWMTSAFDTLDSPPWAKPRVGDGNPPGGES